MVNNLEFDAYWDGDNLDKESKMNSKGSIDSGFSAYEYDDSFTKSEVKDGTNAKGSSSDKGIDDSDFSNYGYDDLNTKFQSKYSPDNKGINDPEFGAYGYDNSYMESKIEDNPEEKSNLEDFPDNKGINDPEFGAYGYDSSYTKSQTEDKEKKIDKEKSPDNKGINDPEFGAYGYDDSYTISGTDDNLDKKFNIEDSSTDKGANNPNKKGNRKALRTRQSSHENTATKETIYFFQDTLLPGRKVNLPRLLQKSPIATFLPRQIEQSLTPMSIDNLPDILKNFSLKSESRGAVYVEVAVKNCARDEMKGETKYCAASLETFVDLSVSVMGKNIRLLWHELSKETGSPMFTIGQGIRAMGDNNNIVCHKMKYPYAVYLCHSIEKTEVYKVPLASDDGTMADAMAACHKDTSAWSPNHVAFKILNVKPGTVPICHFLGRDTLVWIPN